jgi:TPR repeat protein
LGKTHEEKAQEMMKRVEANDASAMCELSFYYREGHGGLQQDQERAMELLTRAVELGSTYAHFQLGNIYDEGGYLKKAKFHLGAAAMAGNEVARYNLGCMEAKAGNKKHAMKHFTIAASSGCFKSMNISIMSFKQGQGLVCRDEIDSTLTAYNNSCVEMRSEARDAYICYYIDFNSAR